MAPGETRRSGHASDGFFQFANTNRYSAGIFAHEGSTSQVVLDGTGSTSANFTYGISEDEQTVTASRTMSWVTGGSFSETFESTVLAQPGDPGTIFVYDSATTVVTHAGATTASTELSRTFPVGDGSGGTSIGSGTYSAATTVSTVFSRTEMTTIVADTTVARSVYMDTVVLRQSNEMLWHISAEGLFARLSDIASRVPDSVLSLFLALEAESGTFAMPDFNATDGVTGARYTDASTSFNSADDYMAGSVAGSAFQQVNCFPPRMPGVLPLSTVADDRAAMETSNASSSFGTDRGTFGYHSASTAHDLVPVYHSFERRLIVGAFPYELATGGGAVAALERRVVSSALPVGISSVNAFGTTGSGGTVVTLQRTVWRTANYQGLASLYIPVQQEGIKSPAAFGAGDPQYANVSFGSQIWYPFWLMASHAEYSPIYVPCTFAEPKALTRPGEWWAWTWGRDTAGNILLTVSSHTAPGTGGWTYANTMSFVSEQSSVQGYDAASTFHSGMVGGRYGDASRGGVLVLPRGLYAITINDNSGGSTVTELSLSNGSVATIPTNEAWRIESIPLWHAQSVVQQEPGDIPVIAVRRGQV
jgi:hypothetical protein